MTAKELVETIITDLNSIMVPAEYLDQMGPQLSRSLGNLRILRQALINAENEEKAGVPSEAAKDEPEIEVVEVGTSDKIPDDGNAEIVEITE